MYIRVIKDMYEGGRMSVRTLGGITNYFYIGMGLYQGSVLSLLLFTLVMDELTKEIQDELPWCMYSQLTLFSLMKPERELMASWSEGDIHWSLEALE